MSELLEYGFKRPLSLAQFEASVGSTHPARLAQIPDHLVSRVASTAFPGRYLPYDAEFQSAEVGQPGIVHLDETESAFTRLLRIGHVVEQLQATRM